MITEREARDWMVEALLFDREDYTDTGGCCRLTKLAEDCAADLGGYLDEVDFEIQPLVFDMACEAREIVGGFND